LNITTIHQAAPGAWAEQHFGEVDLGDLRHHQRAVTIATAMATNPARSIPQMFLNPYDVKAAYSFFFRTQRRRPIPCNWRTEPLPSENAPPNDHGADGKPQLLLPFVDQQPFRAHLCAENMKHKPRPNCRLSFFPLKPRE
jgi:hypothetical protein